MLSGFLGAGKTTLLNHVLNNRQGLRVAIIVNVMSEVNIDADLIREGGALNRAEEKLVEMTNGCICCTLRDDLLQGVRRLAAEGRFDYLLIEGTGIAEPKPVAATFDFRDETGASLSEVARLDTMVTVVDALNLTKDFASHDFIADRGESMGTGDERTLVNLLTDQIEFANVIVLNKVSDAGPEPLTSLGTQVLADVAPVRQAAFVAPVDAVVDLQARAEAALIEGGWFIRARGTTNARALGAVLRAHTLVAVDGLGRRHSGGYVVASVRHVIDGDGHLMDFELVRNAWEA